MSSFFTKNRQPPRWQRKQTAINSHNDQFTIYAQMHQFTNTNTNNNSIGNTIDFNNANKFREQYVGYNDHVSGGPVRESYVETPISHEKIAKMKEKLRNFQELNAGDSKVTSIQLNYSHPNSIHNSRSIYHQHQPANRPNQPKQKQHPHPHHYSQQPTNKPSPNPPSEPHPSSNLTDSQQEPQTDYNKKLDKLRHQLQIISQKQYQHNKYKDMPLQTIQSPQTSLKNKNNNSKLNSQQSTTRNYGRTQKQQYNNMVGNSNIQLRSSKQYNKVQDSGSNMYGNGKNTVPMPTIIHQNQDDTELQQQYRIVSATVQLQQYPVRDKYKNNPKYNNNNNNNYDIDDIQYIQQGRIATNNNNTNINNINNIKQTKYNNNNNQPQKQHKHNNYPNSANNSYGNTLSHKKSMNNSKQTKSQYYYQLFPSYSEQLDMKVYKQHAQYQGRGDQQQDYRIKQELDKIGGSIWVKPNHNISTNNKMQNSGQQANNKIIHHNNSHNNHNNNHSNNNESSKSTKRRDSTTNIPTRNKITQQQLNQRTRSKSKTIPNANISNNNSNNNNNNNNNRYDNNDRYQHKQKSRISSSSNSYSNNKLMNKKQAQYMQQQQRKTTPQNKNNTYNRYAVSSKQYIGEISKYQVHRAMMKQLLLQSASGQDVVQIYSGSTDYTVKYHIHNKQKQDIQSHTLYRHRAPITSLMKIDNILFSTSTDHYLKYSTITPTSPNNPPSLTNQSMYKFPSSPQQLVCANQENLLIGCRNRMYLFDVDRCQIGREIDMGGCGGYRILENGHSLYVGSGGNLDMVDFRCNNPIVNICGNLGNVGNWIMHPLQQYCLINIQNKLIKLDFRSTRSPNLNTPPILLPESQTIIDTCWIHPKIAPYSQLFKDNLQQTSLLLLTQQIISNNHINRLIKLDINNNTYSYIHLSQSEHYTASIANSMNIVREFDGVVYVGDKMGNMFVRECWEDEGQVEMEVNERDRFVPNNTRGNSKIRIN